MQNKWQWRKLKTDTLQKLNTSEAIFTAKHLTDTNKQNNTERYTN